MKANTKPSELYLMCPYHGRITSEYITTCKTCGKCMEEMNVGAGDATLLLRVIYSGHDPHYKFDCNRCKFNWCCGPQCSCHLNLSKPPKKRAVEIRKAVKMFQKECALRHKRKDTDEQEK